MEIEPRSVDEGLEAAFARTRERFSVDRVRLADLVANVVNVLADWPAEADPRFVTLFVELWAVAETARMANGEPQLRRAEIRDFLGHCFAYFNSFKHR